MPRNDQIGRLQPAPPAQQPAKDRSGDAERRIGHHPERSAREPEIGRIDLHHGHRRSTEALTQLLRPPRVKLERDDPRAGRDQWDGERAGSRADVEHEIPGPDAGRSHEPPGRTLSELMPTPT